VSAVAARLAADLLLLLHFAFVIFVVSSLPLILVGGRMGWTWVRNRLFRQLHLAAIAVVVLQSWLGRICPLTAWEMALREQAGDATYTGAFVAHWLSALLYYRAPAWVFALIYTLFGLLVVFAWFRVPPGRRG
jgi:hypothetical protein